MRNLHIGRPSLWCRPICKLALFFFSFDFFTVGSVFFRFRFAPTVSCFIPPVLNWKLCEFSLLISVISCFYWWVRTTRCILIVFYRVLLGFSSRSTASIVFYEKNSLKTQGKPFDVDQSQVLPSFTEFYRVLPSFTEFLGSSFLEKRTRINENWRAIAKCFCRNSRVYRVLPSKHEKKVLHRQHSKKERLESQ